MSRRTGLTGALLALTLVTAMVGCDNATGPGLDGSKAVTLSIAMSAGTAAPSLFAGELELNDGTHTLVIQSAELVIREIEFERMNHDDCEVAGTDDDCEEFETGPYLVALPLDGTVSQELTAVVDTGTYDEIEFDIHKPEDNGLTDEDFLVDNPNFADISIRVTGTYDGQDFLYTTDLNEEQEIELTSPLVVTPESGPVAVTLIIDASTWFETSTGSLIDPRTANDGEPNEGLVEDNIRTSIEGFRDDDHDGIPHDDDDDEDHSVDDNGGTGS